MYLLDSNICIYIINRSPKQVVQRIKQEKPAEVKLSAISLGELEYGASRSPFRDRNRMALVDFVSAFEILEYNDQDAEVFGMVRADLERRGLVIGPYDMQIASQALVRDLVLVTNNSREFERIPGLKLENWF